MLSRRTKLWAGLCGAALVYWLSGFGSRNDGGALQPVCYELEAANGKAFSLASYRYQALHAGNVNVQTRRACASDADCGGHGVCGAEKRCNCERGNWKVKFRRLKCRSSCNFT